MSVRDQIDVDRPVVKDRFGRLESHVFDFNDRRGGRAQCLLRQEDRDQRDHQTSSHQRHPYRRAPMRRKAAWAALRPVSAPPFMYP